MSRHYYAMYWPMGVNTYMDDAPYGTVVPFDSMKACDEWIAADRFDNDWHRSKLDYRLVRGKMRAMLSEFRAVDSHGFDGWRVDGVFYTSLGDAYAALFDADVQLRRELFGDVDPRDVAA